MGGCALTAISWSSFQHQPRPQEDEAKRTDPPAGLCESRLWLSEDNDLAARESLWVDVKRVN